MVTLELAVAIPAIVLVLLVCLAGVRAGIDQVRCVDAARLASRAAARGDPIAEARRLALRAAPPGATVMVSASDGQAQVVVTARAGGWGVVPSWTVSASATTPVEVRESP
jgi:hypothetical protein